MTMLTQLSDSMTLILFHYGKSQDWDYKKTVCAAAFCKHTVFTMML